MNALEGLKFNVLRDSISATVVTPTHSGRIVGIMVGPQLNSKSDLKISVSTENGIPIIYPVQISHLADRPVEWGKNYIPVDVASQKLRITAEPIGIIAAEEIELVVIYDTETFRSC